MKHIVIDARIRRASTGRPVDRFLEYLPKEDKKNRYTVILEEGDNWTTNSENIKIIRSSQKRFTTNIISQYRFAKRIRSLDPDLTFFTMTGLNTIFKVGNNITFTHDLTMLRFVRPGKHSKVFHMLRMQGYKLLFYLNNSRANTIITPSKYVKNDLIKLFPKTKGKIEVVYESSEQSLSTSSEALPGVSGPFIMHVGSPFPHKNINNLVLAFKILQKTNPNLKLVLAGKKEFYFSELENWIACNGLESGVIIPGFISDEQLKWLYENAECYVLPSLSEGFGLPGLEAMAHKCPLVSSNATCMPEIYGDSAIYFDPQDSVDIANKIKDVIDDQELKNHLIKSGTNQLKKYSWQKMTKEIIAIINKNL